MAGDYFNTPTPYAPGTNYGGFGNLNNVGSFITGDRERQLAGYNAEVLDPMRAMPKYDPNEEMRGFKGAYFGSLAGMPSIGGRLKGMGVAGADIEQLLAGMQPAQQALGSAAAATYGKKLTMDRADAQNFGNAYTQGLNISNNSISQLIQLLNMISNEKLNA